MRLASGMAWVLMGCGVACGFAQQGAGGLRDGGYGVITGRVVCADTRLPARFARVVLRPVVSGRKTVEGDDSLTAVPVAETGVDGSFVARHVKAGDYYVAAEKPGYLSATAVLSREETDNPGKETVAKMAALLTPVRVVAERTSRVELTISRGASVSGTVRFDDGGLDSGAEMVLLRQDAIGRWHEFLLQPMGFLFDGVSTDDEGNYRISGLPAGSYEVAVKLMKMAYRSNDALDSFETALGEALRVYEPGAARQRDAKAVKVAEGEDRRGVDIEIPLAMLHRVSGRVVQPGGEAPVNAATVALLDGTDGKTIGSLKITGDDGAFQFDFVPEGTYRLSVTEARMVRRTVPKWDALQSGDVGEQELRRFKDAEQTVAVTSDVADVTVAVGVAERQ